MIKILDFSPYYPPHIGGLEKYAEELYQNLARKGCGITVFVPHIPKFSTTQEEKDGIKIIRYPAFEIIPAYPLPRFWKPSFWKQWKTISQENFDVVVSTSRFFLQPVMAIFYAKRKKIPILHIEHGSDFVKHTFLISLIAKIFDKTIGRFILSTANCVIAPSKSAARFVKILAKKDTSLIYRGMPFEDIEAIQPDNKLKEKFKDKKIIVYLGRIIHGKGIVHLLEAVNNLKRDDIITFIVGDGPEKNNLKKQSQKLKLENKVIFFGVVPFDRAIGILKISDIFVNPSYNEGLPTSVLEAGTCKKAIIATDVGGTVEIITPERSGIVIEPYDANALENALKELLDNEERRLALGQHAYEEIKQKFNWEKFTESYLEIIESLIKK